MALYFMSRPEHSRPRPDSPKAKAKKFGLKAKAKDHHPCSVAWETSIDVPHVQSIDFEGRLYSRSLRSERLCMSYSSKIVHLKRC